MGKKHGKQLKAIYALIAREADPRDFTEWFKQVKEEKNPRGAALLIACNLELSLDITLSGLLNRERLGKVFGPDRVLGSFAHKIALAYALEIFGDQTLANLELIKAVRNAFAHCHVPVTFETPEIAAAVALLCPPIPVTPRSLGSEAVDWNAKHGRDRFAATCDNIGHNLIWGARTRRWHAPFPEDIEAGHPERRHVQLTFEPLP